MRVVVAGSAGPAVVALIGRLSRESGVRLAVGEAIAQAADPVIAAADPLGADGEVRAAEDCRDAIGTAVREFGGIDGLVISLPWCAPQEGAGLRGLQPETWRHVHDALVVSFASVVAESAPHIVRSGGGSIVAIADQDPVPKGGEPPVLVVARAAVEAIAREASLVWGDDGLRCAVVSRAEVLGHPSVSLGGADVVVLRPSAAEEAVGHGDELAEIVNRLLRGELWDSV